MARCRHAGRTGDVTRSSGSGPGPLSRRPVRAVRRRGRPSPGRSCHRMPRRQQPRRAAGLAAGLLGALVGRLVRCLVDRLVTVVGALSARRQDPEGRGGALELVGVLALGRDLGPVGGALHAGLDRRPGEHRALDVRHLERQLEGVALPVGQRGVGGVDDRGDALGDLVAVAVGDRLVELLDGRLDLVVGVAGRGHREHRLGDLDLDHGGGRGLAAVRDAEGRDRVGAGRGVGDGRADVGAGRGDEREGDGRGGDRKGAEAREDAAGRGCGHEFS